MKLNVKSLAKMKNSGVILAILLAAVTAISGCNTTGCTDNRSSIPLAGFYSATDETAISLDSLEIGGIGAPADSLLMITGESASSIYLPFRATYDEISYFIRYTYKALAEFGIADTITFTYDAIPYFASEECGAMFRYKITRLRHTSSILDSVAIVPDDSIITNVNIESLRFYFITADNETP